MLTRSALRERRKLRRTTIHPDLDVLEDRRLMAYNLMGAQWSKPERVTFSIMPDGTSLGGVNSNFQSVMNSNPNTAGKWLSVIQKAAATWENYANINFVLVADSGAPLGTPGNQQNDSRFGDIRIGGYVQPPGQLAFAFAPPPFNGGTNAGDILFNTNMPWNTNGSSSYDLYTVALHEFGHALGLAHNASSTSVMYPYYTTPKSALSADDQAGDQAIYGPIPKDMFSSVAPNPLPTMASNLNPYIDGNNQISLGGLTLTRSSEQHFFQFTTPANAASTMTVQVQASDLSSVVPTVKVLDASNKTLATNVQTTYSTTASVTISGVLPSQVYRIQVGAGTTGPGANGTYGLLVNMGTASQDPIAPPDTTVPSQPDQNPGIYGQSVGWNVGGQFVPYNGDFGWLGREGRSNRWQGLTHGQASDDDGLVAIHFGDGSLGYGDALTVSAATAVRRSAGFAWAGGPAYAPTATVVPGDLYVLVTSSTDTNQSPNPVPTGSDDSVRRATESWCTLIDQVFSTLG